MVDKSRLSKEMVDKTITCLVIGRYYQIKTQETGI